KQLRVGTNEYYKQQLINDLKCSSINKSRVLRLKYRKKELMNFFIEYYNACHGQDIINYEVKQKRNIFNLSIRPGLNISSFSLNGDVFDLKDFHLDNKIGFRFGIEAEYILPFNKNKWGIAIEPYPSVQLQV